jgi:hypothetical protein
VATIQQMCIQEKQSRTVKGRQGGGARASRAMRPCPPIGLSQHVEPFCTAFFFFFFFFLRVFFYFIFAVPFSNFAFLVNNIRLALIRPVVFALGYPYQQCRYHRSFRQQRQTTSMLCYLSSSLCSWLLCSPTFRLHGAGNQETNKDKENAARARHVHILFFLYFSSSMSTNRKRTMLLF